MMDGKEWINRLIVSNITFPLTSYLYNRKRIRQQFDELIKVEKMPRDSARVLQLEKLKRVVQYAAACIPFHKRRFKDIGFHPEDLKSFDDLKQIPPVSRSDVIDFHKEMVDERYTDSISVADAKKGDPGTPLQFARFRKYKLIRNTSSGSTGAPTIFYEDGSRTALNWVHEMRLKFWYGVHPLSKEARLVRLSTDYNPDHRVIRMRKRLWNQFLLPGTNLGNHDYQICLDGLLAFKPKVIWGFPSAIAGLAGYIKRNNISLNGYKPVVAIGWAGPVYEHEEQDIKTAIGCEVSNNYGAREVGHVAGKCPAGTFHVNQENLYVETEPRDEIDTRHDVGEILVSTLDITPMPFIRYRMGDVGAVSESTCSCGRKLEVLSGFMGRTGEIFITRDGRMISPNFWCRFFFVNQFSNAVRRFQVIYKKDKNLKIIVERDRKFTQETEEYIRQGVQKNFSEDTTLDLQYTDKIAPMISGKYQMVVNEAKVG